MDVAVKEDVSALKGLAHHHFGRAVFGADLHRGRNPLTVEVEPTQRGSVVADQHAVGVEHRNYFEHKIVSQVPSNVVVGNQELKDSLDDKRGVALSGVDSRADDDGSPLSDFLGSGAKVSDDGHFAVVARNGFAHDGLSDSVLGLWLAKSL